MSDCAITVENALEQLFVKLTMICFVMNVLTAFVSQYIKWRDFMVKLSFATDYCGHSASDFEEAKREMMKEKRTSKLGSDIFYDGRSFHSFYFGEFEFCIKAEFTEKNVESILVLSAHYDADELSFLSAKTFAELERYMLDFEKSQEEFYERVEQEELEMI